MGFIEDKKRVLSLRPDRSRAQGIDEEVKVLVQAINKRTAYYTTSSCAGRIIILEDAPSRLKKDVRWLLVSHQPITLNAVMAALQQPFISTIWCKVEPLILHVCCRAMDDAKILLEIAHNAGLKHSGIIAPGQGSRIMVEICGSDRLEVPLGRAGKIMVDDDYLTFLINTANKKLEENTKRRKKFEELYR